MLLVIDQGNTNAVFAVYEGERRLGKWRTSTDPKRTADEYAVWLAQLMALRGLALADVGEAVIASVVPAATYNLVKLCRDYVDAEPMVVGQPEVDLGIPVRAQQVGADRLVNAVAAFERYGGPLIVIDFGTATTFDIIGEDGGYEGGVIAPAAEHSVDALYRMAAQLPRVAIEPPEQVIGRATVPAMKSGVYWGYVGLIEGLVSRIKAEFGKPMKVIATGGLAPVYAEATEAIEVTDPDLTLRGLILIHRANAPSAGGGPE